MSVFCLFCISFWRQVNPKAIACILYLGATLITLSCNNDSSRKAKFTDSSAIDESDTSTTSNYKKNTKYLCNMISAFYLEASTIKKRLLNNRNGNGNKAMFVLQFTHETNNTTGLIAWPGARGHKGFNLGSETSLKPTTAVKGFDPCGQAIILGDLQLGKNEAKALFDAVDKGTFNYIVFTPEPISNLTNGFKYLHFKIGGTNDDPEKLNLHFTVSAITETNPSPPRNADDDL